ncbi:MAG: hypothetical protein J6C06_02210 [Lachnospiraceae bacterium]|nr:hypothetical protein [Lachnospiraceae bacterium]
METRDVIIYGKQVVECYYKGEVNWYSFLWYIAQYVTIVEYSENTITILNRSGEAFFKNIEMYDDERETHNYNIDRESKLFREHHRGYKYNKAILESLW